MQTPQGVRDSMARARSILLSFGAFWLSLWTVTWLALVFGKINDRIIYGDNLLDAIAMGVMTSMGRAIAASVGAIITTLAVGSRRPERWALVVATLYVIHPPVRYGRWHLPTTTWDHLWKAVDLIWPAIACTAVAVITARLRRKAVETPNQPAAD